MEGITKEDIKKTVDKVKGAVSDIDPVELEQILNQVALEDKTLKEALNLSDNFIELAYSACYNMYQAGQFEEALKTFKLLQFLDAKDPRFVLGMAKCYENSGEIELAAGQYLLLIQQNPYKPENFWNLYLCFEKMGDKKSALTALASYYYAIDGLEGYMDECKNVERIMVKLSNEIGAEEESKKDK